MHTAEQATAAIQNFGAFTESDTVTMREMLDSEGNATREKIRALADAIAAKLWEEGKVTDGHGYVLSVVVQPFRQAA